MQSHTPANTPTDQQTSQDSSFKIYYFVARYFLQRSRLLQSNLEQKNSQRSLLRYFIRNEFFFLFVATRRRWYLQQLNFSEMKTFNKFFSPRILRVYRFCLQCMSAAIFGADLIRKIWHDFPVLVAFTVVWIDVNAVTPYHWCLITTHLPLQITFLLKII